MQQNCIRDLCSEKMTERNKQKLEFFQLEPAISILFLIMKMQFIDQTFVL